MPNDSFSILVRTARKVDYAGIVKQRLRQQHRDIALLLSEADSLTAIPAPRSRQHRTRCLRYPGYVYKLPPADRCPASLPWAF